MSNGPNDHQPPAPEHTVDAPDVDIFPVSFAQQRLWFLQQLEPDSVHYNIPAALRLHGPLDREALQGSLIEIVARHEALRTTFLAVDGQPMQRIAPEARLELTRIDLRTIVEPEAREAEARRLALAEARQRFDLETGPLLRATLLQLAEHDALLLLTLHHIVADGWSVGIFVHELAECYAALLDGRAPALPALPIQYADWAVWQREQLHGPPLESLLSYWREQLRPADGGSLPLLDLPGDRPHAPVRSGHGAQHSFTIDPALTAALHELSRRERATLFMTLLAAFDVLLQRYTGQTDLLVGTPIANRTQPEIEGLIGFFTNTLVLRAHLDGRPSFRTLLRQVRDVTLAAYEHQDLPFEQLVEALQPSRDLNHNPLFQVMFVLQNAPLPPIQLAQLRIEQLDIDPATAKFDLLLTLHEAEPGLQAVLEYSVDRFSAETIARLAGHFQRLLCGIVANPDQPITTLPLLVEDERQQVLLHGQGAASSAEAVSVLELFAAQVGRTPEAIAAEFDGQRLSYAELNRRANQLAHALRRRRIGPDQLVGVCLPRSLELLVAVLGVLKAGGAYVPLDPAYPAERLRSMLTQSRVELIVTEQRLLDRFPGHESGCVCLDSDWPTIAQERESDPPLDIDAAQLAYVLHTSGSTGRPKGVAMGHGALANLIGWHLRDPALSQPARTLHFAPISFDVSFQELFSCWCSGGTLLVIDDELRRDPPRLLRFLDQAAVERLFVPFVALQQLAEAATTAERLPQRLREIITAGEQLQISLALASWLRQQPGCTLHNHYGPTEGHVVTSHTLAGDPAGWPALPPIGRPVANTQLYIVDRQLQPVPIGVAGELLIGGTQLARGYLHRPDLTAEKFVPNPFAEQRTENQEPRTKNQGNNGTIDSSFILHPLARVPASSFILYKTGDRARWLPDGTIEFLGRVDDQVKVRGYRVEPGEIEAVLREHPAVREAAVIVRDERLVAYVVAGIRRQASGIRREPSTGAGWANPEPGGAEDGSQFLVLDSRALRSFAQERLPEYMIPSAFVVLDALPLTLSGKLDRRALLERGLEQTQLDLEQRFVAPRSPLEQQLADIWAEVLGGGRIGVEDNFFEIGGHSLLATQISSRIRTRLQVDLPLRTLFERPTIAALAAEVTARAMHEDVTRRQIPAQPRSGDDRFPLSFAQQRLWFLDRLDPGSLAYMIPAALRLRGPLDSAALQRSLDALVARHETLRTTFAHGRPEDDGQPVQIIGQPYAVALPLIDLRAETPDQREQRVSELLLAEARRPFDLETGPLLRATLLRTESEEHVLLLTLHHIIADGWSMNVLIDELTAFYRSPPGQIVALAPLPVQYADWSVWQRDALQHAPAMQQQLAYWRSQLAGAPTVLTLPIAQPRSSGQALESAAHAFELSRELTEALELLSRREQVTLFMTLLAAFDVLLYRYTGQTDLLVGTPSAGRTQPEIEGLIGFFINTLVLRARLDGNPPFVELLRRVRTVALEAYAHQDLPFEQVVREVQPERALHQQPLVQTVFVFQSNARRTPSLPGLQLSTIAAGDETAKFDLTLLAEVSEGRLEAVFKYNQALFPAAAIARLAEHFSTLLAGIVASPTQPIGALPLLTPRERQRILRDWNATATPYPAGRCYHELFEAQAARTPEAIAVLFERQELSYRELNERANQLARHLRALGVGGHPQAETRVGICVERSLDLVVALLGVLKAGGAYVPLDPAYPAERLQFMLRDAQVGVLLSQRRLLDRLPAHDARLVCLDSDWPEIARQPADNLDHNTSVANLAYVIYTSGSTGLPKGVMVTHEGIGNLAAAQINDFGLGPGSRVLQFVSFSFDGAVSEFVMALLSGATLCLALPDSSLPGPALAEQLRAQAVTTMKLPPSVLTVLPAAELPALRTVISAGEPCSAELVRRWRGAAAGGQGRRFFNAYGPSENTVCATIGECDGEQRPHVGRPLPNKQIYLVDANLQPVPVGVPGELLIGGIGLARGYLDRPALTAERFIPNPFAEETEPGTGALWANPEPGTASHVWLTPGSRLYRTGDLARWLPDGNIEFVGRVDHQVKVRGFRIELHEIEVVLRQHPAVRECVAIVREDVSSTGGHPDRRVVAYIVGEPRTENREQKNQELRTHNPEPNNGTNEQRNNESLLQPSSLRQFLAEKLPGYMIPSAFVVLDALPLTPNGKIDRDALPEPSHARPELETGFVAARSWAEQTLARLWAEVLRLEQVGVHDNFFDLGGDSILSIQITARANQAGLRLTPRQLFEHQTIAELAAVVGTQQALEAEQALVTGPVALTPIQRRFFEQEQPQPQHWNQSLLLEARTRLDPDRLSRAIQLLLAHHDALRLRFVRTADSWQQHNAGPDDRPPLITIDLTALHPDRPDEQLVALEQQAAAWQARLDLADGPLFQAVLFDLGEQRLSRLLLVAHHLVVDAVSWRTLLEDLQTAYQQLGDGSAVQLPPKTSAFQQWAARLSAYAQSDTLAESWAYWRDAVPRQLPRLPLDDPGGRARNTEASARSLAVTLDADETRALLQDVPQVYHTQINDVLLTALALASKRQLGLAPLLVDLEGQGREPLFDDLDVSRTVGWFTTVFPVLLTLPDERPGEALRAIKEQLRRIPQHGIGYGLLRYLSQQPTIEAELRAQPQAEIGFNYLGQLDQLFDADALLRPARESAGPQRASEARRAHLLDVNAGVFDGRMQIDWTYSPALHHPATVEALAQSFVEALRELIAHCLDPQAGGYTASDFSAFNWSQADLDDIASSIGKLMGES